MDDYKIALGALLDANAKEDIDKQLNAIKDLSVTISKATLSNDVINDIKRQLTQNGIDLKLVFGNVSQITNQAKQTGQQIGQQIQNGINDAIQKGNLQKDFFFSADKKNGVAKQAQEYFRGISNGVVTVTEQMENLDDKSELRGFIVNIKNAKGEVESLKYSLRNILDDNGNVTGQKFAYVSGSINDAGAIKQFEELNKVITDYEIKLANLKTKYSNMNVDYSAFDDVFNNFKLGIGTANDLALAFNQLENSAKKGVQSLKSQTSSFDPIQQTLNNMRDLPSMLTALEANMSGVKDKTSIAEISVDKLRESFDKLDAEMQSNGGKVPITDEWLKNYRDLMSTVTSATKQVDALKKAEASDNSQTQKQANYYSTILSNYREIYSLKQKLLTAGKEETKVIQEQIRSLNSSNASINKQLGKQGLKDSNWQTQVDDLKEELDYSLRISEARQKDKANQSSLNNAQREAIQIVEELEQAYQRVQDIKIKIASLDKAKDGEKISTLSQEEESAQAEYKQLYDRLRKRKNYDKESWNETKSAIDSATKSQIEYNNAASQDTLNKVQKAEIANFRILKDKWDKQGLLVDEFRAKVEAMESSLSSVGSKGELDNLKIDIKDLKTEATQLLEANKAYKKAEKELTATLEKRRAAQANSAKEKAKSNTQQELAQQREVNAILSKQESAYKEIWNINKQIANLDTTEDADVIGALNEKKKFYQDIYLSAQKELQAYNNIVVSHEHLASLAEIRKKAESEIGVTVAKQNKALAEEADRIQLSFDDGTYEAKYDSLIAKTRQWINANDESVISTQRLTTAYNEFNQAATAYAKDGSVANRDKLIQKEEELARQIKATTNEVKSYNAEYAKSSKVDSLHQKIQEFYDKNTATHRKWGAQLKNMLNETAHGAQLTATRVNEIEQEFLGVGNAARQAGKLGDSFFGGIKKQAGQFLQWFSVTSVIMEGVQQVRKMVNEVKTLDNAMMDLTMATGYNKSQIEDLMDTYFKLGDKLSATASDVAASADTWLRQGKSIAETNKLIEDSMVLSKIGGLSSEDSTKYLTSVMKGYKVATEDVIGVVDKLSAVDMASATDVGGLAEGMSEVAASADLAGVSMDKLLGYLATIGEVTQSGMSEVGTTLNAVFARMGNIKLSRLKDYETGEDLSNVETVLRGVGINLRDSMNSFRDFDEVLDETASNWNNYSEVQQRAIAQAFSGTHHMNEFIILMENYDTALKYTETSLGSTGQAMEKFEAYEESIAGHTEKFKNAFQDLSNSAIDSGLINFFIDLGTTGIKAVDGLVDALGGLGAIGAIGGGILGAKNIGKVYECTFSNCFEYALHT